MPYQCIKNFAGRILSKRCLYNPIFVVGSGRSGTSILLQALGKHRKIISFPGEAPFLTSIGGNASLMQTDNAKYYQASLKTKPKYFYECLAKLGIECAGGENYALKLFLKDILSSNQIKSHWAAKTFPPENVATGLISVFPNAKFIYICRNGIDVVHSMSKYQGFRESDFADQCHAWNDGVFKYLYMKELPSSLCLRHEELIANPISFFQTIFNFLNMNFDSACIDFVKSNLIHPLDQPNQTEKDVLSLLKQRSSPFDSWTPEQKQTFISICSESMTAMNYVIE